MEVANGGKLYVNTAHLGWYVWQNNGFVSSASPTPPTPPTSTAITLSPMSASLPDNVPAGTLISTANVTMSDGSQYTGTLTTSDTALFAVAGLNIITKRAFISADAGAYSTVITPQ